FRSGIFFGGVAAGRQGNGSSLAADAAIPKFDAQREIRGDAQQTPSSHANTETPVPSRTALLLGHFQTVELEVGAAREPQRRDRRARGNAHRRQKLDRWRLERG